MNHKFHPSFSDNTKCLKCKYTEIMHGDQAECEVCNNIGEVEPVYGGILMCESCLEREMARQLNNRSPEKQNERVKSMNEMIESSRSIDNSIQVHTDLFNAQTISIIELKSAIDNDESITNKPYALAKELSVRFAKFSSVIFEKNQEIIEATNKQKAIQVYLNNLANQLRIEEREQLHIKDVNYTPNLKKIDGKKKIRINKKIDKVELKKYAMELGVSEF